MQWRILPKITADFIERFPQYPLPILQLLYNREFKTQEQIDEFLSPDFEGDIHDPFLMKGIKEAVVRIIKAILEQERIIIYGDYDVDGVCSSLILKSTLQKLGAQSVEIYIPDRHKEGYGLNTKILKEIGKKGPALIITVDCGISNFDEVDFAQKLGLEIIITDHHQVLEGRLPDAKIIINPHQEDDNYPFSDLAGAGVAYKLAQALLIDFKVIDGFDKWLLDLVALATVADGMPLLGENRTLVKYGLIVLNKTRRIGLLELVRQSRLLLPIVNSTDIAFALAPRLNAAGRMEHANMAFELLATESFEEAKFLAERLCQLNSERQVVVDKIIKTIEKKIDLGKKLIFEGDKKWLIGVLGIVAGKLCDKYRRPTMVFGQAEEGEIKGTGRSFEVFNLVEAMTNCSDLFLKFGGHPCAAGFSFKEENLEKVRNCLIEQAEKIKDDDLEKFLDIDLEINSVDFNWQVYDQIKIFAPFGRENREPIFLARNLKIDELKMVGNGNKHLKMNLCFMDLDKKIKTICFNFSQEFDKLKIGDRVDVAFEMIANEWNGFRELEMKIIDVKKVIEL